MRTHIKKLGACALAATLGLGGVATLAPAQQASAASSTLVISEAYGGGGNNGAPYNADFVELYNLSDGPVNLSNYQVSYHSASGNHGQTATLPNVSLEPGAYYLLGSSNTGTNGIALPAPDQVFNGLNASGSQGSFILRDNSGTEIDLIGFGGATLFEGAPTPSLSNSTSAQRTDPAVDTDNNAADFTVGAPTPQNSGGTGTTEPDPEEPVDPVDPSEITPIAEIQGTGASTPLNGQTVTTQGVVTAVYTGQGSKNGFYIQEPGAVDLESHDASTGVFIYGGSSFAGGVEIGDSVQVTGSVSEFSDVTQITTTSTTILTGDDALGEAVAVELPEWPATDAEREVFEGMLLAPQGDYVVTDNYSLNQFGEIGLGFEGLLLTPTEVAAPGSAEASAVAADNDARGVLLDDGQTWNYMNNNSAKNSPLPYLTLETPVTIGASVDFSVADGVVLDYGFGEWRFQPTAPVKGTENSPVAFEDVREDAPNLADRGDVTVATFNVLNYFTTLGGDRGCSAYNDREGNPIATSNCSNGPRGAYNQENFDRQEDKIVAAIEALDASVISLEEIEDSSDFGQDRDYALSQLVEALNEEAGADKWEYVATPEGYDVPTSGNDVIRTAFIYQPAEVSFVEGTYEILDSPAFTEGGQYANARAPLASSFIPVGEGIDGEENQFIVIGNHFKSKGGSGSGGNSNTDDNVGGWNLARTLQAEALVDFAADLQEAQGTDLVFITGDINAYSAETPITTIVDAGYEHLTVGGPEYSYSFGGTVGSLDHVFASPAANDLIVDQDIWTINANEAIALEYSRYNYNVAPLYDSSPFRSSDHNPAIVALDFAATEEPVATGGINVTYFDDDIVNNAFDDTEDLRSGLLYAKDANGNWFGTGAGPDGTFNLANIPTGEYQLYLPLPNVYESNVVFDTADASRLEIGESERVQGATWIDSVTGEQMTFTVVDRLSAISAPITVTEGETASVEYGLSAITAQAEVVLEGSDEAQDGLATLEFTDGEDTYFASWNDSADAYNALTEEDGSMAYFLAPQVGLNVTPAAGYEVVSITATSGGETLEIAEANNGVNRIDLASNSARVYFTVTVAAIDTEEPVAPTVTLVPEELTQSESVEGITYQGADFAADTVRIEIIQADGTVSLIDEAAQVTDGAFNGSVFYRDQDGNAGPMPVGIHTLRFTQVVDGEDIVVEATFEVVADEDANPTPTTPGEDDDAGQDGNQNGDDQGDQDAGAEGDQDGNDDQTGAEGDQDAGAETGQDGNDDQAGDDQNAGSQGDDQNGTAEGNDNGSSDDTNTGDNQGNFEGDNHEGGLAKTGAEDGLLIALAVGVVLLLAGAGVMIQRRRA